MVKMCKTAAFLRIFGENGGMSRKQGYDCQQVKHNKCASSVGPVRTGQTWFLPRTKRPENRVKILCEVRTKVWQKRRVFVLLSQKITRKFVRLLNWQKRRLSDTIRPERHPLENCRVKPKRQKYF